MNKNNLDKIRNRQAALGSNWIRVGMSTCGIAAGAGEVYDFIRKEIDKNSLDVRLRKCGCLGACYAEPLVEVSMEGLPPVVYGNVTPETAERIIKEHVISGRILDSGVYELRTADIHKPL